MSVYNSTDEFYAIKLPNLPRDWVEEANKELGELHGSAKLEAQFRDGINQWTDWTKRVFGKLRSGK